MDKCIDLLCLRLADIEQQLYGYSTNTSKLHLTVSGDQQNSAYGEPSALSSSTCSNNLNLLKMLAEIENKLKALTIGKDRFNQCFNELQRLRKWLGEDDHLDSLISTFGSHSSVVKFEQVLAFEDEIRIDSERMSELERLLPSLDQPHLSRMVQLEPKLIKLKLELFRMQLQSKALDYETKDLIDRFNIWHKEILGKLKQFNEDLTEMEKKQEEVKYDI